MTAADSDDLRRTAKRETAEYQVRVLGAQRRRPRPPKPIYFSQPSAFAGGATSTGRGMHSQRPPVPNARALTAGDTHRAAPVLTSTSRSTRRTIGVSGSHKIEQIDLGSATRTHKNATILRDGSLAARKLAQLEWLLAQAHLGEARAGSVALQSHDDQDDCNSNIQGYGFASAFLARQYYKKADESSKTLATHRCSATLSYLKRRGEVTDPPPYTMFQHTKAQAVAAAEDPCLLIYGSDSTSGETCCIVPQNPHTTHEPSQGDDGVQTLDKGASRVPASARPPSAGRKSAPPRHRQPPHLTPRQQLPDYRTSARGVPYVIDRPYFVLAWT